MNMLTIISAVLLLGGLVLALSMTVIRDDSLVGLSAHVRAFLLELALAMMLVGTIVSVVLP